MWDIFEEMRQMQEHMNKVFEQFFKAEKPLLETKGKKKGREVMRYRTPISDVHETENSVIGTFELPGVDKKDIQLNVTENSIEVKVEKKAEKEIKKEGAYAYAAEARSFYRSIPLPAGVDPEKTKAEYKNGMLKINIPKLKRGKKKKIDIK